MNVEKRDEMMMGGPFLGEIDPFDYLAQLLRLAEDLARAGRWLRSSYHTLPRLGLISPPEFMGPLTR